MITSLVSDQARGPRGRALPTTTQTTQPQKQIQATAEQIGLAQMLYDKNDVDYEDKVKQLIEVTGKTQDECMVALHDCNEDVNRAINLLLEGSPVTDSWETVGKKRGLAKDVAAPESKESREKKGEREAGRGKGAPSRRGRGGSRGREVRSEENGLDVGPGDREAEPSRRGGDRWPGGRGRGRAADPGSFSSQGIGTFNPAEYSPKSHSATRESETPSAGEGTGGTWQGNMDDWATEDWSEDLFETKVFTASTAPATENHITPGPSLALGEGEQGPLSMDSLGQGLVFTNSHHSARTATHSYARAAASSHAHSALSSVPGSGFGSASGSKPSLSEVRIGEPHSRPRPGPAPNQAPNTGGTAAPTAQAPTPVSSNEVKTPRVEKSSASNVHLDVKMPEPSPVLSQLVHRQPAHTPMPQPEPAAVARGPTPPGHDPGAPPRDGPLLVGKLVPEAPIGEPPLRQIKAQRRKLPPHSKIPLSAVEMPGSVDSPGLNVQFGALDFGSDPALNAVAQAKAGGDPSPAGQTQGSLFSSACPSSELHGTLPLSESAFPSLPSALPPPSLGVHSPASSSSRGDSSGALLGFPPPAPLTNGFRGEMSHSTHDASPSSCRASKPASPPASSSSHTPPSHSHVTSAPLPGSSVSSSSAHTTASESSGSVSFSSTAVSAIPNGVNGAAAPGVMANGMAGPCRTAPLPASAVAKAPPNLAQGVPPLLANQYIMGPGGLLPAYPIYGYEDLQMLQSRMPVDYYGVPFPGTAAPLPGRDNPYSGEATKFGRGDSSSPGPPTSLSTGAPTQPLPPQAQSQAQQSQAFLNPPLPPGYGFTGLPYYPAVPGVPSPFQYGPTVFMPPASAKQPGLGLGNPSNQYQHQPSYGQHAYGSGFEELPQAHAAGEYSKGGYGGSGQSQAKSAGGGQSKGLSVSVNSGTVSDMSASVYSKTQSFDKPGFHTGTPPPFSLPSALGGTGPLAPGGAPGYAPASFLHILPHHQQPHSQLLQHHLGQDGQVGPGQRSQASMQQKSQSSKTPYASSPYWAN